MTIEKLKSGSYRIKQMVNGQMYRVTVDHKPKKAEAEALIQSVIQKPKKKVVNLTLSEACRAYNESRSNILSPATLMGYESTIRNIPDGYDRFLSEYNSALLQALSNEWSKDCSPKTVKNRVGYIYTVLKFHDIEIRQATTPQNIKETPYIPTEEEVSAVLNRMKDTKYWAATMLGVQGLRRSEILALTLEDLNGNVLTINKALVPTTKKGEYVVKSTKTSASTRKIVIPDSVADRIREQGFVYKGDPGGLIKNLTRIQKELGIKHFTFHKLRHFFASYMNGKLTDKQIQEIGGWRDGSRIMKIVYQHAMDMESAKATAASLTEKLSTKLSTNEEETP